MRILVQDAYMRMGQYLHRGYYKRLNLAHNSSIEVQTH